MSKLKLLLVAHNRSQEAEKKVTKTSMMYLVKWEVSASRPKALVVVVWPDS